MTKNQTTDGPQVFKDEDEARNHFEIMGLAPGKKAEVIVGDSWFEVRKWHAGGLGFYRISDHRRPAVVAGDKVIEINKWATDGFKVGTVMSVSRTGRSVSVAFPGGVNTKFQNDELRNIEKWTPEREAELKARADALNREREAVSIINDFDRDNAGRWMNTDEKEVIALAILEARAMCATRKAAEYAENAARGGHYAEAAEARAKDAAEAVAAVEAYRAKIRPPQIDAQTAGPSYSDGVTPAEAAPDDDPEVIRTATEARNIHDERVAAGRRLYILGQRVDGGQDKTE